MEVTHFVRPGKQSQFKQGVELDLLDERKGHLANNQAYYPLRCVENVRPEDGYELIMVPVNAHQLTDALRTLIPCVGEAATFLLVTSNWEGTTEVDALLPRQRYLLGLCRWRRHGSEWRILDQPRRGGPSWLAGGPKRREAGAGQSPV